MRNIGSMPSALAGRAGLALVEFQLGRRGFEFVRTPPNSKSGDLWAETGIGRISIEVKATFKGASWFIKRDQTSSEFFCLTSLSDAACYVLTTAEMAAAISMSAIAWPGVYVVHLASLPIDAVEGWHRLGGDEMKEITRETRKAKYVSTRTVRHTLADGSTKVYSYAPTAFGKRPRKQG